MPTGTANATYCRYHCSACGRHFASVEGFDYHRVGSHEPDTRRCTDPARRFRRKNRRAAYDGVSGVCRIGPHCLEPAPGIVWSLSEVVPGLLDATE